MSHLERFFKSKSRDAANDAVAGDSDRASSPVVEDAPVVPIMSMKARHSRASIMVMSSAPLISGIPMPETEEIDEDAMLSPPPSPPPSPPRSMARPLMRAPSIPKQPSQSSVDSGDSGPAAVVESSATTDAIPANESESEPIADAPIMGDARWIRERLRTMCVKRSGLLAKQSPSLFAQWQVRWFHMNRNDIFYWKANEPYPAGSIDLSMMSGVYALQPEKDETEDVPFTQKLAGMFLQNRSASVTQPPVASAANRLPSRISSLASYPATMTRYVSAALKHVLSLIENNASLVEIETCMRSELSDFVCPSLFVDGGAGSAVMTVADLQTNATATAAKTRDDYSLYEDDTQPEKSRRFAMEMINTERKYEFKAPSRELMFQWIEAIVVNFFIHNALHVLSPEFESLNDLSPTDFEFTQQPKQTAEEQPTALNRPAIVISPSMQIPCNDLYSMARSGDMILFESRGLMSSLVRSTTSGEYDHCGIILRFNQGQVGILEALGQQGVMISNWRGFVANNWSAQYSRVAIRFLETPLSHRQSDALQAFVKSVVTANKKRDQSQRSSSVAEEGAPKKTYFSSELVAAAYRHIGLLRPNLEPTSYMPGAFAQKSALKLLGGAKLSPEFNITFDQVK